MRSIESFSAFKKRVYKGNKCININCSNETISLICHKCKEKEFKKIGENNA